MPRKKKVEVEEIVEEVKDDVLLDDYNDKNVINSESVKVEATE